VSRNPRAARANPHARRQAAPGRDRHRCRAPVPASAGAGSVFESVRAGRRLLVVVNPGLMDNHQSELAAAMAAGGHLSWTTPEEGRVCAALAALPASFAPLPSPAPALDAVAAVLRQET